MYNSIDEIPSKLKQKVVNDFRRGNSTRLLSHKYNILATEVLAILEEANFLPKELMDNLSSHTITQDRFLIISDTHIGSKFEEMEYIKYAYKFAFEHGITTIVHLGDLIQSIYNPVNKKYINEEKQLEHLIKDYPYYREIKTLMLFGNHDYHTFSKNDEYLKVLKSRKDFNVLGFKRAYLTWAKQLICLQHDTPKYKMHIPNVDSFIIAQGHRHKIDTSISKVVAPTLSKDIKQYGTNLTYPGFLEVIKNNTVMEIYFHYFDPYRIVDDKTFTIIEDEQYDSEEDKIRKNTPVNRKKVLTKKIPKKGK